MKRLALWIFTLLPVLAVADLYGIVVQGLGGMPKYTEAFEDQVSALQRALESLGGAGDVLIIGGDQSRRDVLLPFFEKLSEELDEDDRVALFLVGHGSYDGKTYKFNIPGPDISGEDIATLLDDLPASRQLVVVTGSSSGAVTELLASDERIVITATRSGSERNATGFGTWFVEALEAGAADINKNEYVTVREAYDYAARSVEEHFDTTGTLATEHSQFSGKDAEYFNLARLIPEEPAEAPQVSSDFLVQRQELDERIQDLQLRRSEMSTEDYYAEIEVLMLELARLETEIETSTLGEAGEEEPPVPVDVVEDIAAPIEIETPGVSLEQEIGASLEISESGILEQEIGNELESATAADDPGAEVRDEAVETTEESSD